MKCYLFNSTLVSDTLPKNLVTCKYHLSSEIMVCHNIFHHLSFLFVIADLKIFCWCNVIQQIKRCPLIMQYKYSWDSEKNEHFIKNLIINPIIWLIKRYRFILPFLPKSLITPALIQIDLEINGLCSDQFKAGVTAKPYPIVRLARVCFHLCKL